MSAIIVTPAPRSPPAPKTLPTETSPLLPSAGEEQPLLRSTPLHRSEPLKSSLTRTRFVLLLAGVWSANFVIAFQAMAVPTTAPAVGSWFGHAELGSYLGSMFSLANTAGESSFSVKEWN